MNRTVEKDGYYAWIFYFIWPFLAAASAFLNYRKQWSKNIFWAFCVFYGFTYSIGLESEGSDVVGYVSEFQRLYGMKMTLAVAVDYFLSRGEIDVLRTVIAVVLSRLTDSQVMLTGVYAIIFGYFYSRNLWYIMEHLKGKMQYITVLLLACFFLIYPIWKIGGFRMATASQMFVYGVLPYMLEGRKKGFFIAGLSVLVHFSFLVPVGLLVSHAFLGNRLTVYFGFFLSTFVISEINITAFNNLIENYFPEILQDRTSAYRREEKVIMRREDTVDTRNWYAIWYGKALAWSVVGFLIMLFFRARTYFEEHPGWMGLFCYVLLFYGVANLFSSIPSGGRYVTVANLLALPLIILYIQNHARDKLMKRFIIAATPALLLFMIVSLRMAFYSFSATSILGNPLIAFFSAGENISLNDILRMIL